MATHNDPDPDTVIDYSVDDLVTALRSTYVDDMDEFEHFNECLPLDEWYEPSALNSRSVQIGFGSVYGLIWVFGVGGNSLVLLVLLYSATFQAKSRKQSDSAFPVRSVFVGSLASADLLIALTSLPVTAMTAFTRVWIFPSFLCYCIPFFQAFSIFQSSFTLTNLAIDRYLLIAFPRHSYVTYNRARFAMVGTGLVAAAIASPMAIFMKVVELPPMCGKFCVETWPHSDFMDSNAAGLSRRLYGLFVALLQLCLPTVVTSICYVLISNKLEKQQQARRATHLLLPEVERRLGYRRRRTNRMMALMVAAFALLWLPLNAMNVMRDFGIYGQLFDQKTFNITYASCHLLAMFSIVWNPLIYAWYNKSIKSAVVALYHKITRTISSKRCSLRKRIKTYL